MAVTPLLPALSGAHLAHVRMAPDVTRALQAIFTSFMSFEELCGNGG